MRVPPGDYARLSTPSPPANKCRRRKTCAGGGQRTLFKCGMRNAERRMERVKRDTTRHPAPSSTLDSGLWTQDSFNSSRWPHQFTLHFIEDAVDEFAAVI